MLLAVPWGSTPDAFVILHWPVHCVLCCTLYCIDCPTFRHARKPSQKHCLSLVLTSTAFVPTSSTTAPSFIQSPLTISACPHAAMTISACWQTSFGFGVRECTTVTVASRCCNNNDTGIPTMLLRPITTARLPEIVMLWRSSNSRQPCKENHCCYPPILLINSLLWAHGNLHHTGDSKHLHRSFHSKIKCPLKLVLASWTRVFVAHSTVIGEINDSQNRQTHEKRHCLP